MPCGSACIKAAHRAAVAALCALLALEVCGCSIPSPESIRDTRIILTTGLKDGELFALEGYCCRTAELAVYMADLRDNYQNAFGDSIWDVDIDGIPISERLVETAFNRVVMIKTMQIMADHMNIDLTAEEEARCLSQARTYIDELSTDDRLGLLGITDDDIILMMKQYARAYRVYEYCISDVNPEVSDDAARRITVQRIVTPDISQARQALRLLKNGSDFEELMQEYNGEGIEGTLSFGKNETEKAVEDVTFSLTQGEISDIVETAEGYCIYRCITTFNREETDANKLRIIENRRRQAFAETYSEFAKGYPPVVNEALLDVTALPQVREGIGARFFELCR